MARTMFSSLRRGLALMVFAGAATAEAQTADATAWTWSGWGGGGFFWSAAFDPTDSNVIYLGGDVAGIYKSEDQGKNWRFINRGLQEYGVFSLAVAKNRPQTVYAMTMDGVAKSVNGGADWEPLAETRKGKLNLSVNRPGSVRALAIDPTDSETVYAGSGGGALCKSQDGGQTWTKLDYRAALPPVVPVVAAASAAVGTGCVWMAYASAADDWKSHGRAEKFISAAGEDWTAFRRATAKVFVPKDAPKLEIQIVVQSGGAWTWQAGPNVVGKPGEWVDVALDFAELKDMGAVHIIYVLVRAGGQAYRGELGLDAVTLVPTDETRPPRALGDWEKAGSLDGWKAGSQSAKDAPQITALRNSADVPVKAGEPIGSVVVADANPKLVFVAHRTLGLFRSTDAGATWQRPATPPTTASSVAVAARDAKRVYGAFGKAGVWKSDDAGLTWTFASAAITNACGIREVAVDPRNPDVVHAVGDIDWGGYYYRSKDAGATWQCIRRYTRDTAANPTLPEETGSGEFAKALGNMSKLSNLALSPSAPDTLFLSANWNNILSTDGGTTWTERDRGADISCVHDLRFCGPNTYAAAMDEGLLVSADNGASWRQIAPKKYTPGLSGHQWRVSAVRRGDQDQVVSTVSAWTGEPNGVVLSADGGRTFSISRQGLPTYIPRVNCMWGQGYARALAVHPTNPDVLYLGIDGDAEPAQNRTGGGIFKSVDAGRTWAQLPNQPGSRRMFYGLAVDPTEPKRLYWGACGAGGGVYRSDDEGGSWKRTSLGDAGIFNVEVTASGAVYAGGNNLSRSTDGGQTWKQLTKLTGFTVVGIATDPENEQRLWVSAVTWDGSSRGGIHRSTDGGATWQEITGDIGYRKPLILRYNASTRELWAGGVGLFRTKQ